MSSRGTPAPQVAGNLDGAWLRAAQDPHSLPFQRLAAVDALAAHYARASRFLLATLAVVLLLGTSYVALAPGSSLVLRVVAALLALVSIAGGLLIAREGRVLAQALQGWLAVGRERTIPIESVLRPVGKVRVGAAIGLITAGVAWAVICALGVIDAGWFAAILLPLEAFAVAGIILGGLIHLQRGARGVLPSTARTAARPADDHTFSPQLRHAPSGPIISVTDPAAFGAAYPGGSAPAASTWGGQGQQPGFPGMPDSNGMYEAGFHHEAPTPDAPPVVAAVPWSAPVPPAPSNTASQPFVDVPDFVAQAISASTEPLDETIARPLARPAGLRVIVAVAGSGTRHELAQGRYLLGRAPVPREGEEGLELIVVEDRGVSKTHLILEIEPGAVFLTDRASSNGTTLRGANGVRPVPAWERVELGPHDQAVLGSTVLMRAE